MNYEAQSQGAATAIGLRIQRAGTNPDYSVYLYGDIEKTDRVTDPDLLDFALVPYDNSFVKPRRGDYIIFDTATYPNWFTGYITNDPDLDYIGKLNGQPVWGFKFEATSDEYLLNLKPIGILSPFMNTTQGAILKELANRLAPGKFDVTNVQDGQLISRYVPDPEKTFSDIAKEFSDSANYRISAKARQLYFAPQDSLPAALTVDATDMHFTPSNLSVAPSKDQIVNDAIVLGDIEPQAYVNEYFVGDGITSKFPMIASPFGVESAILLDETFQGSTIDEQKWNLYDVPSNLIRPDSGFLNILGGMQFSDLGVYITSASLLPLEGHLRMTHGEFDFVDNASVGINGVICSLWNGAPQMDNQGGYPGCFFGIEVKKSGSSTLIRPIVGGTVDNVQVQLIDFSKRYVIRTLVNTKKLFRAVQDYSYLGQDGNVGTFGGGGEDDTISYTTIITCIDPQTGNVVSQTTWVNSDNSLSDQQVFANYVPAASNDLHCTLTNITISTPMQVALSIKKANALQYVAKMIGPNEIDSYDGESPVATITQTNAGPTQKSSILGSPKYNPGQAALEFFKDSTKQTTTIPQLGDIIHLSYRQAGAAVARVQSLDSIAAESAAWGDNGLRSVTRKDLKPSPRTSAECEAAAASIVADGSYPHYEGTYTVYSPGFGTSGEPVAGTILSFRNLDAGTFPQIVVDPGVDDNGNPIPPPDYIVNFNEVITEVRTTILSKRPEYFQHEITFGKMDRTRKTLAQFQSVKDVFTPQDAAEVPVAINIPAIGNTAPASVSNPKLTNWDRNSLYFDTQQDAPVGGGFEVRYTDDSWGAEPSKNLVTRSTGRTFSVPRNFRSKVVYVRAYDSRNKVVWSNDFSQIAWKKSSGATVRNQSDIDRNSDRTTLSIATLSANATLSQDTGLALDGLLGVFSIDLRGSVGQTAQIGIARASDGFVVASTNVSLTGDWQRPALSFDSSDTTGQASTLQVFVKNISTGNMTLRVNQASLELGTQVESVFCKTRETPYGATSRHSAILRVNLPLIPTLPSAIVDAGVITAPVVEVVLPDNQQDVWAFEIRASDNATVLLRKNLADSDYTQQYTQQGNRVRDLSFFVYTINLLGEYSDAYNAVYRIPTPKITTLIVDEDQKLLRYNLIGARGVAIECFNSSARTYLYWNKVTASQTMALEDPDFFQLRYFVVIPYDDIGGGQASAIAHQYQPQGVVEWDGNVIFEVEAPAAPYLPPPPPPGPIADGGWTAHWNDASWTDYNINRGRNLGHNTLLDS